MAIQRLPIPRIAGIVAWTAASVAWGTALVAAANTVPEPQPAAQETESDSVVLMDTQESVALAPVPTMPESGLVVLRYTPAEKPVAQVVVRRVVVSSPSSGGSTPAKAPTKVESSGS